MARVRLAGEGLPRGDSSAMGYELLDQDVGFTITQRSEDSRHQRAQEGELSRSIASLSLVQSARVHLALAKPTSFLRDRRTSSASVIVHLKQGKSLSERDVSGIVHLVASSVADLEPQRVTVVDQSGRLLTGSANDDAFAADDEQFEYARRVEQRYVERILDILMPVVGADGVRAQVVADLDFTQTEQSEERFEPQTVLRSEKVDEESSSRPTAEGVPGSTSNQPPATGILASLDTPEPDPVNTRKSSVRNWEVDRQVSHTRYAPGRLTRLSVAVVIDHNRTLDEEGNLQATARSDEQMAQIRSLVQRAVGLLPERGDSLEVVNEAFYQLPAPSELEPEPIWQQPWLWQALKQFVAPLAVLILLLLIFRPTIRNLAVVPPPAPALPLESDGAGDDEPNPAQLQQKVNNTQAMISNDPARAAQVVSDWLSDPA